MKKIGIIGGLGPESTIYSYREITREYYRRHGDHAYPGIVIDSLSFQPFIDAGYELPGRVGESLSRLSAAGADFAIAPCNSLHLVHGRVAPESPIPWVSIAEPVVERARRSGHGKVLLLGTVFTMGSDFFPRAFSRAGIETILPAPDEREAVNRVIYRELVRGEVLGESRALVAAVIERLAREGAGGVVLACTELPLLLRPGDVSIEVFDTTAIQAHHALDLALAG